MPSVRAASRSFAFPPGRVVLMRFATASAHGGAEQQRKADVVFALAPSRACRSMALAVDALVAAHDAHREHPVRAHEPSSSRPIARALTVVGRERSHARRERSRNPRPRARHCQRVRYPRPRWRERTRGRPCGAQTRGISPDECLLRDTGRRVCWTSATRGQRADEGRGSQGLPGVDDRSCSG